MDGDGWISVKDRLPENGVDVIVGRPDEESVVASRIGGRGWGGVYSWAWSVPPTHWMPLPASPKATANRPEMRRGEGA